MDASHTCSTQQHRRSKQSAQFQGRHLRLVSKIQYLTKCEILWQSPLLLQSYGVTARNVLLQIIKMSQWSWPLTFCMNVITSSFYPVRPLCEIVIITGWVLSYGQKCVLLVHSDLWQLNFNQFVHESNLTFMPSVIKFPPGISGITQETREWDACCGYSDLRPPNLNQSILEPIRRLCRN